MVNLGPKFHTQLFQKSFHNTQIGSRYFQNHSTISRKLSHKIEQLRQNYRYLFDFRPILSQFMEEFLNYIGFLALNPKGVLSNNFLDKNDRSNKSRIFGTF